MSKEKITKIYTEIETDVHIRVYELSQFGHPNKEWGDLTKDEQDEIKESLIEQVIIDCTVKPYDV